MNSYAESAADIADLAAGLPAYADAAECAQYAAMDAFRIAIDTMLNAYRACRDIRAMDAGPMDGGPNGYVGAFAADAESCAYAVLRMADTYEKQVFLRPSDAMIAYARFTAQYLLADVGCSAESEV